MATDSVLVLTVPVITKMALPMVKQKIIHLEYKETNADSDLMYIYVTKVLNGLQGSTAAPLQKSGFLTMSPSRNDLSCVQWT